jgi:enamine deaminase RidA (YjgF/YER057c/UK114 family)
MSTEANQTRLPPPAARYSPVVRRGPFVAVSGQVPFLPGRLEGPAPGIREQAETVFGYLKDLLESTGAGLADVLTVRIYLTREEDFAAMNQVFDRVFGEVAPTRTTVWVHLPGEILIEADVLAVVGS